MSFDTSRKTPQDRTVKPVQRVRRRLVGCCSSLLALVIALWYIGVLGGNVREVDAGRLYRSSQLTGNGYEAVSARMAGHSLQQVIEANHINTVLNLRGGSMKDARYRDELRICKSKGVDHIDDSFSARSLPPPEVMDKLLDVFDHAKYPILVHCQAGSDRTGLVCTIYANIFQKQPLDIAENRELTWRFGHIWFANTHPMDEFFDLYRTNPHGANLRNWIRNYYPSIYAHESTMQK